MDRTGQRVRFHSYEKPDSRELEGTVVRSWFDDNEDGLGWYHTINPDIEFISRKQPLDEKENILRTENELII